MPYVTMHDPRNPEAPGRRLEVLATTSMRPAEDHVVALFLLEDGYVLFRSRIGASQTDVLLTPESFGVLRELAWTIPDKWWEDRP